MMAMPTDEFSLLSDVARDLGRSPIDVPTVRRVEARHHESVVSGILWGDGDPEVVFLHGGGQNAHTWDAVVIELGANALALDLPGHGQSSWRSDHNYSASANAEALADALDQLAPNPRLIVGMSLGGLSLAAMSALRPALVKRAMLVDILPDIDGQEAHPDRTRLARLRQGSSKKFRSRDEMVEQVVAVARRRPSKILERGVFYNSVQDPDGLWRWRYDPARLSHEPNAGGNERLWKAMTTLPEGSILLKGERSTFVGATALEKLRSIAPQIRVETIADAGHSIQGDQPQNLARRIQRLIV